MQTSVPVDRWVERGIITAEQADLIRADLTAEPLPPAEATTAATAATGGAATATTGATAGGAATAPSRANSLMVEAMAYVGGVIVVTALLLLTGRIWADLNTVGKVALTGGVTTLLVGAGFAVPQANGGVATRLRAVLWFLGVAMLTGLLGVVVVDVIGWSPHVSTVFATGGAALGGIALWRRHRTLFQHIAVLVTLFATVIGATSLLPDAQAAPGVAVWGYGAVWALLAWGGLIPPRRAGIMFGAAVTVIGAAWMAPHDLGTLLSVATVALLVLAAVAMRDLLLLAIASVGTLIVLPIVIDHYVQGTLPVAAALLVVGAGLIVVAVGTARRRQADNDRPHRDWSRGSARTALLGACWVTVATAFGMWVAMLG
jgi:hypothetical protein